MNIETIPDIFEHRLANDPDGTLFEYKIPPHPEYSATENVWHTVTAATFDLHTKIIANFLLSKGLRKGARLAILARCTYESVLLDFAAQLVGIVVVPIYET
jgi:long-chain acyl-CoA synthetase